MDKGEAWRKWWTDTHGKNMPMGGYHPIEGFIYDAFTAGWDAADKQSQIEITHLKEQLLRVGNQQEVLKAAYLAGQMSRPVKTFSGNKPNYVVPPETEQRPWIGLTKEEAKEISMANRPYVIDMIAALEARLKEKNT